MRLTVAAITAAALTLLSACSDPQGSSVISRVTGMMLGMTQDDATSRTGLQVSAEEILANPGRYVRVNVRDLGVADTMVAAADNNGRVTWAGGTGISVTLDQGVVVATRGLPRDLMGSDASATLASLRNGRGNHVRTHDFLSDQDQIQSVVLQCRVEAKGSDEITRLGARLSTTRVEERCTSDGLSLTNVYWLNQSGRILRSLQAVSPDAGYLQIDAF
ncbi:YjbF family lipoprotein [Yoonia litorea]|uniref:Group 4 capsule polysaccharide lipoprotein gfcB, YjbF n=1 Tax=Yoonia litorea TaxID=1123755 RepID=A0A1I6MWS9_9RHOB|nr:YjbF family lipoprotein [Yoonia litorea]SFS20165.1 Group 4 capsule polysaccharide lipoprotein gfcB, YjbF [Yoonia litorea]